MDGAVRRPAPTACGLVTRHQGRWPSVAARAAGAPGAGQQLQAQLGSLAIAGYGIPRSLLKIILSIRLLDPEAKKTRDLSLPRLLTCGSSDRIKGVSGFHARHSGAQGGFSKLLAIP